jgi:hypothetical protein
VPIWEVRENHALKKTIAYEVPLTNTGGSRPFPVRLSLPSL